MFMIRTFEEMLVVGGAWLNSCVEDTERLAVDLGFLVNILEDGVIATKKQYHNYTIVT